MKLDLNKVLGEKGKRGLFTLIIGLLGGLIGVSGYEVVWDGPAQETTVIPFAQYTPEKGKEDCDVMVRVKGLVDLTRVLEVHCETAGPDVTCESVVGQLWLIDQLVPTKFKESEESIKAKVKPPVEGLLIGKWYTYGAFVEKDGSCAPKPDTPVFEPKK